jgi:hypothetical protein
MSATASRLLVATVTYKSGGYRRLQLTEELENARQQAAFRDYLLHRQQYPLPEGWSEKIVHVPGKKDNAVLCANDTYHCDLSFRAYCDSDAAYYLDLYVLRHDRQLPTEEEVATIAKALLGEAIQPEPNGDFVAEGYDPDGTFRVLWPVSTLKDRADAHFGCAVWFVYPPVAVGAT